MNAPSRKSQTSSTTSLSVQGMSCASCVGAVERALRQVPGVVNASVNLATERATITGSTDMGALVAAVAAAGYEVRHGENAEALFERRGSNLTAIQAAP